MMRTPTLIGCLSALLWLAPGAGFAYPGGTPDFQTDVTPFCAACHSSIAEEDLAGAGERAKKEVVERKHLAAILNGDNDYGELSEVDRQQLVEHIRAVDANSRIELEFPPIVAPGEDFQVTVNLTGGAGPVVAVALVDRAHRWFAKSATAAGWEVFGTPTVIGPSGLPQGKWLGRRPEDFGRNVTFVNVAGVESDAVAGKWSQSQVIFTLKAPAEPGNYPLVGAYFYGTEKATPLGYSVHPLYGKSPRGGYTGKSGRVKFSAAHVITVKAAVAEPAD
jgi:hypothetical protein